MNYTVGERLGTLAVAAALLFAALRIHKSVGRRPKFTKPAGVILALVAGLALLTTFVGSWLGAVIGWGIGFAVAGLIISLAILGIDLHDGRPDKPAFWAAFVLPLFLVLGVGQLPAVGRQIGNGGHQVEAQFQQQHGKPAPHASTTKRATKPAGK